MGNGMITMRQFVRGTMLSDPEHYRGIYAPVLREREVLFSSGPCTLCGHRDAPFSMSLNEAMSPNEWRELAWVCQACWTDAFR